MTIARLPRRTFLQGLGTALALPYLEAMSGSAQAATTSTPRRAAFIYIPNGAHMQDWTPEKLGADFKLPWILEPFAPYQQDMLVLTGLAHDKARANGDGPGDHARAAATFLTARQAFKTAAGNIRLGVSTDQIAANAIGRETPFPSLELGCEMGVLSGGCDSGYSCAYNTTLAWKSPTLPLPKEINPRLVFDRLFGGGDADEHAKSQDLRLRRKKSILDLVQDDARRLEAKVSSSDKRKLEEFYTSIRDVESRLSQPKRQVKLSRSELVRPTGIPKDFGEHIRLMGDMMVLAFQTDMTRVVTWMIGNEGSNRNYPELGVPEGHHDLSHHGRDKAKQAKIRKINRFHVEQFAYVLKKLKSVQEGDSNLLDNSVLVYGSGIGDGDRHNHDDLPILVFGKAGGRINTGRHLRYPKDTPMGNLLVSVLDSLDVHVEALGDSTGRINLRS